MKTRFLLAVITNCIMMACVKTPKSTNPLEELAWLKAKKTDNVAKLLLYSFNLASHL